jgi:uncharacterized protein
VTLHNNSNSQFPALSSSLQRHRLSGVIFALVFPAFITWIYFDLCSDIAGNTSKIVYLIVKTLQFCFPAMWVLFVLREPIQFHKPGIKGIGQAIAFSLIIVSVGWIVFELALRDLSIFTLAAELIRKKIAGFGIDSAWKYAVLAVFYSLIHSLFEEYYWRWFVFRQLRQFTPLWPAIIVSSLAFMAHHVVVLSVFFHEAPWLAWLLSAAVAVGGAFWAWLYERSDSLVGPWISHLLIDAGIFWIGYELIRGALATGT